MSFPDLSKKEAVQQQANEIISTLKTVNYQIKELTKIKTSLENKLYRLVDHPDEGQRSYVFGNNKVTLTSGYNYTLNKELYAVAGTNLRSQFNPVRERVAYDLDKKVIRDCEKFGTAQERQWLADIICKKPKKIYCNLSDIDSKEIIGNEELFA